MSSARGNVGRTRAQKYKNRTAFKNDLHDKTPQQKRINSLHVSGVCQHCKDLIDWKIKYKKYKPLTQAKTCTKCQQRNILKAYHVLCRECAKSEKVCAKCLKPADQVVIEPAQPTPEEEIKLKVEMNRLIKSLPERKRRAFLRYLEKGKIDETPASENEEHDGTQSEVHPRRRVPHSRDDLLKRIAELKMDDGDDFDSDDESGGSVGDGDSFEDTDDSGNT